MSKIRRAISLVLALLLTASGAVASFYLLFLAQRVPFRAAAAAGFVLTLGLIWLYSDFIDATPNDQRE